MAGLDPRFAKIIALMRSTTHPPEQASARRRAEAVAASCGRTYEEALEELTGQTRATSARASSDASGHQDWPPEEPPPRRWTTKQKAWLARRVAIITRYGSESAAIAPCAQERLILDAVRRWRVPEPGNERWTKTLDGMTGWRLDRAATERVREAITRAYPMPTTFQAARDEYLKWKRRNEELGDLRSTDGEIEQNALDLAARIRMDLVEAAAWHGIRITSLDDLLGRLKLRRSTNGNADPFMEGLFRDVELMARSPDRRQEGAQPMTMRAYMDDRIRAILTKDATMSDRRIALAAGCSPTTVGTIRRAMGLASQSRTFHRDGRTFKMKGARTPG